ncbi:hypothetical protein SYNTR_1884 [Candidatus Syntrophocurvum alkaliphilum]|uniref:BIG2 domain-containing protein n=1 Tax=Candidatus Syntrophocurvum alkaliphilum TaxID=2293317 RepID=A0A6I6DND3_9FIRM|nr:hypothetical protein [Candidatus Syntrophocurvum alkaliphilum]QGU00478.1 hypothetical protein SYNTR_1884 [Candidatus Syntrophocurvum alkaliphilum]
MGEDENGDEFQTATEYVQLRSELNLGSFDEVSSSDEDIATASYDDEEIIITSEGAGTATITVVDEEDNTATIVVTVAADGSINVDEKNTYDPEYTVIFSEENEIENVSIEVYSDEGRTQRVGDPVITDVSGDAAKDLVDGNYWIKATLAEHDDFNGTFEVSGEAKTIDFEMLPEPQKIGSVFTYLVSPNKGESVESDPEANSVTGGTTATSTTWSGATGEGDKWQAEDTPVAVVTLTANEGYIFENTTANITVNNNFGSDPAVSIGEGQGILQNGKQLVFTATYEPLQ